MKKILIVGCGELGSRFLQAALSLREITQIDIVEPSAAAKETSMKRMHDVGRDMSTIAINWVSSLAEINSIGDMAIIATHADVRLGIFEAVINLGYKNFLVEKIVTQSEADYLKMMEICRLNNVRVWVNCKTRNYPIWEYIQKKIDPSEKLMFHSIGGNHGLCTNGLHTIDLFVFLTAAQNINVIETRFDQKLHLTKRGKYDVSGQIQMENDLNKSILILNYDSEHDQPPVDILITKKYRWIVDNSTRNAFESSSNSRRTILEIPFEGDLAVSAMSKTFIRQIITNNQCSLPSLADCYLAHRVIFDTTLPLFNNLLNKTDDKCPVT